MSGNVLVDSINAGNISKVLKLNQYDSCVGNNCCDAGTIYDKDKDNRRSRERRRYENNDYNRNKDYNRSRNNYADYKYKKKYYWNIIININ